ncbi:MAG: DUF3038 domain-containing protein [Coleofasciculaceae cyanobacterium SM2_3_26]|nr:DUF3038 domain-containing protein [Coleofasciculaceae cyanobacterium SM2_3_26]
MVSSERVMSSNPPLDRTVPEILNTLPDPPLQGHDCPRRVRMQIDLILLAIEALDLRGSDRFLLVAKELNLQDVVQGRVFFWQLRNTSPIRRYRQRRPLSLPEAKALVLIATHTTRLLASRIRELLLAYQRLQEKQMPLEQNLRLATYLERFRAHFRSRMNPRRSLVVAYLNDKQKLNELAIALLGQLLFCTGVYGSQRLWTSLFDGEVS